MRAFAATAVLLLLAARGAGHAEVQGGGARQHGLPHGLSRRDGHERQ